MENKKANDYQVAGNHYREGKVQHWDFAAANNFDYFQGQITKYITRWKKKNGLNDLLKARHFLDKYIEIESGKIPPVQQYSRELPPIIRGGEGAVVRTPMTSTGQVQPFGYIAEEELGKDI